MKAWFKKQWLRFRRWIVAVGVTLGLITAPIVMAVAKDFSWTNPTQRVDGTVYDPATEQAEIRIYCDIDFPAFNPQTAGASSSDVPVGVSPGASTTLTVDGLAFGNHECGATSVDIYGEESFMSGLVTFVVTPAKPEPPVLNVPQ
jgi:hypothetical protein